MAGYGWSYLIVTQTGAGGELRASDGGSFAAEAEMFRELGVTGWEPVAIREAAGTIVYYFKLSRS